MRLGMGGSPKSKCRERHESLVLRLLAARCQGKSLRISNEITRNDCSQGFPNEIDARARSQEVLLQVCCECATSSGKDYGCS